jgi:hypothetical protein
MNNFPATCSPNSNPIEEAFSKIKAWIHHNYDLFPPGDGFLFDVKVAMDSVAASQGQAGSS